MTRKIFGEPVEVSKKSINDILSHMEELTFCNLIFSGNTKHIKSVSRYFHNGFSYNPIGKTLSYQGTVLFPDNLNGEYKTSFLKDMLKGVVVLCTGKSPEIYIEGGSTFGSWKVVPHREYECNSKIPYPKKKNNDGFLVYMLATKNPVLAEVLKELSVMKWINLKMILEIIIRDVKLDIQSRTINRDAIKFKKGNKYQLNNMEIKKFIKSLKAARNPDEDPPHLGKSIVGIVQETYSLEEAISFVRKFILIWIEYKYGLSFNFLSCDNKKLKLYFSKALSFIFNLYKNKKVITPNIDVDLFQIVATISGNVDDLTAVERCFGEMCQYNQKTRTLSYKTKFIFTRTMIDNFNVSDFFVEERNILVGIMLLINSKHNSSLELSFNEISFINKKSDKKLSKKLNQHCKDHSRSSMACLNIKCINASEIYYRVRGDNVDSDLLCILIYFSKKWSWNYFNNICEVLQKPENYKFIKSENAYDIEHVFKMANNSNSLYERRHAYSSDLSTPENPYSLGRAYEIIQSAVITLIEKKYGISLEKSEIDLSKLSEDVQHMELKSFSRLYEECEY